MLQAMVAAALLLWGWALPLHVTFHDAREEPAYAGVTSMAWVDELNTAPECEIWTGNRFYLQTPERQLSTVTHEIGHCLGLDHVAYPSIMRDPSYWFTPQEADLVALRRLHPLQRRAFAAVTAN